MMLLRGAVVSTGVGASANGSILMSLPATWVAIDSSSDRLLRQAARTSVVTRMRARLDRASTRETETQAEPSRMIRARRLLAAAART